MLKKILPPLILSAFFLSLLLIPAQYSAAVAAACSRCLNTVVPSLFLFMTAGGLIRRLDLLRGPARRLAFLLRPFNIHPSGAQSLVLGTICGFPIGAIDACEQYRAGNLDRDSAQRLIGLCNNCSPAFLCGVVGSGLFGGVKYGFALWGVILLGALLAGLLLRGKKSAVVRTAPGRRPSPTPSVSFSAALVASVREAARNLFYVCAFIVFFSSLCAVLDLILVLHFNQNVSALLYGVIEMTAGIARMTARTPLTFALAGAVCSVGGLSVTAQTLMFTQQARLSIRPYLSAKALAFALTFVLAYFIGLILL